MTQIPAEAQSLIDVVITHPTQEGGWKLTQNANDPDGGWTYAGCTSNTFHAYCRKTPGNEDLDFNAQDMVHAIATIKAQIDRLIYNIYFENYWQAMMLDRITPCLRGAMLSCGVNCGTGTAQKILSAATLAAVHEESLSDEKRVAFFLREWTRHYHDLVVENAKAWWLQCKAFEHELEDGGVNVNEKNIDQIRDNLPKVFRAGSLGGWFNRVEFWRK